MREDGGILVSRRLFWKSPYVGCAIMPGSDSYVSNEGTSLINTVFEHVLTENGQATFRNPAIIRSEDNGETWREIERLRGVETRPDGIHQTYPPGFYLDSENDVLIRLFATVHITDGNYWGGWDRYKMYYQISHDGAITWSDRKQIIQEGAEYNEDHWASGVYYGKNTEYIQGFGLALDNGDMLFSSYGRLPQEQTGRGKYGDYAVRAVHARWNGSSGAVEWHFGNPLRVPWEKSPLGACEGAMAPLRDGRWLCATRSNKNPETGSPSIKYCALSSDDGLNWGEPLPFTYDNGATMYSTASYSMFIRSSKTGKLYFVGNVLKEDKTDVTGQLPRTPLVIAEVNEEEIGIRRDTITVIDEQKEGDIARSYSNFGLYEDRITKDLVLTMCEQCESTDVSEEEWTADACRYDIRLV